MPVLPSSRRARNLLRLPCKIATCKRWFANKSGLTQHMNSEHPTFPSVSLSTESAPQGPSDSISEPDSAANASESDHQSDHDSESEVNAEFHGPGQKLYRNYHTKLTGRTCDEHGAFLLDGAPAPPYCDKAPNDWSPFQDFAEFELVDLLYTQIQMSGNHVNKLLDVFSAYLIKHNDRLPFGNADEMYELIDRMKVGDVKWENFGIRYTGERNGDDEAPWMDDTYDVWMRDPETCVKEILGNPEFATRTDICPYREFETATNSRRLQDFMSGDWAWKEADIIARDPETHGSVLVPLVLGSDKTTVSVATGQHDYYPLYLSVGNLHNTARRAHKNGVMLIGFLAMPKTTREHSATPTFRKFRRQAFHTSLSKILERLTPAMSRYTVIQFGDGHFRRVIFSLGPYIADYEEQVLLSCIVRNWCAKCLAFRDNLDANALYRCRVHTDLLVETINLDALWDEYGIVGDLVPFTNDFLRADIHEMISPDLLHQLIKGAFKDHIVEWIERYLVRTEGKARAQIILDDIDRRIAAVAPFSGLRRFPQGRHFKQWTGNDSKALMKVYLPAIEGHLPPEIVRAVRALLDFCYLVRRHVITDDTINAIEDSLRRFHEHREVFRVVVPSFSLPRQHSMVHYVDMIRLFGAPNGLCSSITESKHIKAVKEPYRRSNRNNPLGQMLLTNQRIDKLAAARRDFAARGMLNTHLLSVLLTQVNQATEPSGLPPTQPSVDSPNTPNSGSHPDIPYEEDEGGSEPVDADPTVVQAHVQLARTVQRNRARNVVQLSHELKIPHLALLISRFLFEQLYPDDARDFSVLSEDEQPQYDGKIKVFNSASSMFFAPSDMSGIHGMRREHIRSCPSWRSEGPRHDCAFVSAHPETDPMNGFEVVRIIAFFSFNYRGSNYPCAVVRWFNRVGDAPDEDTGMWMVRPGFDHRNQPHVSVLHVDAIYRAAHLIPFYGNAFVTAPLKPHDSYDTFRLFYVNRFVDHHSFEVVS